MQHPFFTYIFTYIALSIGFSINAHAAPSVAVDIAPLHSLVSQVMENVGQPKLLIPAEASPHHYTMRPSEAKALSDADVVFWIGESFTPWLEKAIHNVASSAQKIEVLNIEGTIIHEFREGATFESHDHGEDEDHKDEKHEEGKHHEKEAHHDEGSDPHAWLDPENAKLWVNHIRDILSQQDPENALTYSQNAVKARASLNDLIQSTRATIDTLGKPQFILFHDAYLYFEKRFDISAAGSISLGDAEAPSPARIKEVREKVKQLGITCIFTEPQYNPGLVKNVFEGTSVSTIGVMDPLGVGIPTGSNHYQSLIQGMINSLSQCKS